MPGGAARNLRNIDNNSDNLDNTVKVPEWNTSSLNLPTFINDLGEWLYAENVRFKRLIEDGTAIDKRSVCCESQHHIDKIVTKTFTKGTFQEPAFGPPDPSAVPVAPAATPGAAAPADETPAGGVTVSITSSSPAAPVTAASAISSPSSRFTIFPEGIEELDNKMFNTIAECIKDPSTVKKLKRECKQSGRLLLVYLHAKEKKGVSDGMYNALQSEYARAVKADIGAPTIAAFNAYKSEIERCHDVLPPGLQDKDAVRAQHLSAAVSKLGDNVDLLVQLELRVEGTKHDPEGVSEAVVKVLGDIEAKERRNRADAGHAFRADRGTRGRGDRDPLRNPRDPAAPRQFGTGGHPNRAWNKEKDDPCPCSKLLVHRRQRPRQRTADRSAAHGQRRRVPLEGIQGVHRRGAHLPHP